MVLKPTASDISYQVYILPVNSVTSHQHNLDTTTTCNKATAVYWTQSHIYNTLTLHGLLFPVLPLKWLNDKNWQLFPYSRFHTVNIRKSNSCVWQPVSTPRPLNMGKNQSYKPFVHYATVITYTSTDITCNSITTTMNSYHASRNIEWEFLTT
jgi:hypothetical protein